MQRMSRALAVSAAWLALSCRVGYDELSELAAGVAGAGAGAGGGSGGAVGGNSGSSSDAGDANGSAGEVAKVDGGAPASAGTDAGGSNVVGGEGGSGLGGTSVGGSGSGGAPAGCRLEVFDGHDYAFCDTGAELAVAVGDCAAVGMYGVRIDSDAEQSWLHSQIPQADKDDNSTALWRWLGATDAGETGDWSWGDGEQFWTGGSQGSAVSGLYNNWVHNHPLNTRYCAAMEARSGGWYAMPCTQARPYVCERY